MILLSSFFDYYIIRYHANYLLTLRFNITLQTVGINQEELLSILVV